MLELERLRRLKSFLMYQRKSPSALSASGQDIIIISRLVTPNS